MKKYLECGKIVTTHGIKGEVKVIPWTDTPEVVCGFKKVFLKNGETKLEVSNARVQKNMVILKIKGYDLIEDSRALIGSVIYADRNDFNLKKGAYFIQDLIGLDVIHADDQTNLGKICDVTTHGSSDVFHIKKESGKIWYLPRVESMVLEIDVEGGKILCRPIEGLVENEN